MKYYIFGGSGFVGKYLVEKLIQNSEVIIGDIVKPEQDYSEHARYIPIDIRKREEFSHLPKAEENDIVVNLAANQYHTKVPRKGRDKYFSDTNTLGAKNILDWMERNGLSHLVQYTTDMTYGKPQYLPVDTKHPQVPFGPYGKSKKQTEDICRKYRARGMHITIFRPRMINGPGRLGILKKLFILIKHNFPVPTIGNGNNCYQMISVFDCVEATRLAIEKGCPNKEYNLGSENAPSTRSLLQGLIKSVDSRSIVLPTPGKLVKLALAMLGCVGLEIMYKEQYMIADENYILDISDTVNDLGWKPRFNDQDMIIQAYEEWKNSEQQHTKNGIIK